MGLARTNGQSDDQPAQSSYQLSVVIPAYNEEGGIAEILDRVLSIQSGLQKIGVAGPEVLVVDDGSKDRTAEIVCSYANVRLIKHLRNRGYGGALKTGFANANGNLLSFLDADGTYPPEYFPQLCQTIVNDGAELVVGSRMAGAKSEMPKTRRLGNLIFARLVSIIGNQKVSDSASGQRVFRREILEQLYPLPDGLNFTPVMSTRAIHENIKMVEVPIPYSERVGRSKLSVVKDGVRFLNSIVLTALSYNPVRILGLLGVLGVGFAILVAAVLTVLRLSGVTQLGTLGYFVVFTALVLGVAGVSLFTLGVMFNYLVSLFQKRIIQRGLFGKRIFDPPLETHFGTLGIVLASVGAIAAVVLLVLALSGWTLAQMWLWMIAGAMATLIGLQLIVSRVIMNVLSDLSQRESKQSEDMRGNPIKPA
ncbi:MAG TPA: glycosyltransferase family 2 protein [Anaerolineae bacterium]|nr:glycosyltransferase family 2 protein [Anaerolineae bacterium]